MGFPVIAVCKCAAKYCRMSILISKFHCSQIDHPKAIVGLKYMLLMKIMLDHADEVTSILSGKLALRHAGQEVNAMKSIAKAAANRC